MQKEIRRLQAEDIHHVQNMQTNMKDDYVPQAFYNLIKTPHVLYGLFIDEQLASVGGYSIFADELAMLGRLRSDIRFHGHGYATEIMTYIRDAAFQNPLISWVGANTQKQNKPTRRVLDKINFTQHTTAIGAISDDVSSLESGGESWQQITSLKGKRYWLEQTYLKEAAYFPYGCYYLLPVVPKLFTEDELAHWTFYENEAQTRFVIMKPDEKSHTYLHVAYPWDDIMAQPGIWETISHAQHHLATQVDSDVKLWLELSEQAVHTLPHDHHPFELPSPWMLYGIYRDQWS